MHTAIRPYATAGVALVGASVIAVSPIAPSLPDIHIANPLAHVSASVELTQAVSPITTLVQVIQTSVMNLATTGGQVLADPFPVLRQVIANQLGFAKVLTTAAEGVASALVSFAMTLPMTAQTLIGQLASGDIADAVVTVNNAVVSLVLGAAIPLLPVFAIPGEIAQNVTNVLNLLGGFGGILTLLAISPLSTLLGTNFQFGVSAQAVIDAVRAGDLPLALNALLNGPIQITGAFLNGVPGQGFVGILSPSLGLLNVLAVEIPQLIATTLGAPAPAASPLVKVAAVKAPSALPSAAPNLVALPTAPTVKVPAPAATNAPTTAATVGSGPVKKVLTPLNPTSDGNKVTPKTAGAQGTKSGGGLASALSKIDSGLTSKKASK